MELTYVCPRCKGTLLKDPGFYSCKACEQRYPVILGIPDFRIFPDPYINIEDDRRKGQTLAQHFEEMSFHQLVSCYWEMTPGVPQALVQGYVRAAHYSKERSASTWETINSSGMHIGSNLLMDAGCATAGFLAAVSPKFDHAVGLDIAFRWLVVAKKRLQELGITNATLVCACAEHMPFPDNLFDLVVAEDLLDHTKDQASFVQESARVLVESSGVPYFSTPNRYSLGPDPHVQVAGVGYLPPRFRDRYVRWRKGVPYGPISPISYGQISRLLKHGRFRQHKVLLPGIEHFDRRGLSAWQRAQARLYQSVRAIPWLRYGLKYLAPSLQVLANEPSYHS